MTLTLVLTLLSSQVIYEWVDEKGQSHFTDDRSTIPEGVKAKETKGAEVSVVSSPPREASARDGGVEGEETRAPQEVAKTEAQDTCSPARADLARAEERATAARAAEGKLEEELSAQCGQKLLTHGQGSFAQCMAGRSEAITRDHSALQRQIDVARETLRLAEAQGCR